MYDSDKIFEYLGGYGKFQGLLFGVEIEAEGNNLPSREPQYDEDGDEILEYIDPDLGSWDTHEEGSINGAEYVMQRPLPLEETLEEIDFLFDKLTRFHAATLKETPRSSIHVHVNCGDRTMGWLKKALPILAAAEPFLIHHSGRHRKGNLFCLSRQEAPLGWTPIINAVCGLAPNQYDTKYTATNFVPLWNYGSIEFRMMRGLTTAKQVKTWVTTIAILMDAIDAISDNHDWKELPYELTFLSFPCGLAEMRPGVADRLNKQALQSAQEVIASLSLTKAPKLSPKLSPKPFYANFEDFTTNPWPLATASPEILTPYIIAGTFNEDF